LINYKNKDIERVLPSQYPELHDFVEHECSVCKSHCIVPSLKMFKCLVNKIEVGGGKESHSKSIDQKLKSTNFPNTQIHDRCLCKKGKEQTVFDIGFLSNNKGRAKENDGEE
jgi:hypothetical protein